MFESNVVPRSIAQWQSQKHLKRRFIPFYKKFNFFPRNDKRYKNLGFHKTKNKKETFLDNFFSLIFNSDVQKQNEGGDAKKKRLQIIREGHIQNL